MNRQDAKTAKKSMQVMLGIGQKNMQVADPLHTGGGGSQPSFLGGLGVLAVRVIFLNGQKS